MHPLTRLRLERRLTREQLAAKAGVARRVLFKVEELDHEIQDKTIFKLADALEMSAVELAQALAGSDEPEPVKDAA